MIKEAISHDDYLKLRGLAALAVEHTRALEAITKAAAVITGEEADKGSPSYFGCTSDEFYEQAPNIDGLLNKLGIEVETDG